MLVCCSFSLVISTNFGCFTQFDAYFCLFVLVLCVKSVVYTLKVDVIYMLAVLCFPFVVFYSGVLSWLFL